VQDGRQRGAAVLAPGDASVSASTSLALTAERQRRRSRLAAGVAVLALVVSGGVVAATGDRHEAGARIGSASARQTSADRQPNRDVAVQALLDQRAAAVEHRNQDAFLAAVDPAATRFRQRQARMFEAMAKVPYNGWTYELAGTAPFRLSPARQRRLGAQAFTAKVLARYLLAGYDHAQSKFDLYYTFRLLDGRWVISGDTDGDDSGYRSQRQLWDFGVVNVARGKQSIVLGLGSESVLKRHALEADDAVAQVSRVWGTDWSQKVVLLAPGTQAQLGTLLGAPAQKYSQIAAVTHAEAGIPAANGSKPRVRRPNAAGREERSDRAPGIHDGRVADRIVINPAIWGKLSPTGRRIVMSHEVTHVATRTATTQSTPTWLSEGFADYVGYLGSRVPADVAAGELLRDIRADGPPRGLPATDEFGPNSDDLAAAYEEAWLACRLIAMKYGEEKLVAFYRQAGTARGAGDGGPGTAFTRAFGVTTAQFTAAWRGYLARLA
jgi:hypothetical protein